MVMATRPGHDPHEFGRCFEECGEAFARCVDVEAGPELGLLGRPCECRDRRNTDVVAEYLRCRPRATASTI